MNFIRSLCHPEFISGSIKQGILVLSPRDAPPQQQMPKQAASCSVPAPHRHCHIHTGCRVQHDNVRGFTLAEVLITLAIIGTVAALTIPTVVRNYQKRQTVVQLKKAYSALANTTNLAIADHGPIANWEVGVQGAAQTPVDFANKYLIPYLNVSKNCETKTTEDCKFEYSYLNSTEIRSCGGTYSRFYLTDGTFIAIYIENDENHRHANIYIDINGQKKPNRFGKDIYRFLYYIYTVNSSVNGRFIPAGSGSGRNVLMGSLGTESACNKNYMGVLCAALIMFDGWQIKEDYPW